MLVRISILIFSIQTFLCFSIQAETPWAKSGSVERELPWRQGISSARKENRKNFFNDLSKSWKTSFQSLSENNSSPELNSSSHPSSEKLDSLPWSSYQKEWSLPYDSVFEWPVSRGKITSGFGSRNGRPHEGLDVSGKFGQPIKSVANGRVVYSGVMSGYGRIVVIYHGGGVSSVYAHNRENLVKVGDLVEKSQPVATIGQSGRATGPHLHFEIRKDGEATNPLRFRFHRDWSAI